MSKKQKQTYKIKGRLAQVVEDPDVKRMVAAYLLRQKFKGNNSIN